jgi:hypothetical protein
MTKHEPREVAVRSTDHPVRTSIVVSVIGLSWLGLFIHNLADLGGQVLLGPETVGPTAVYLLLAAGWLTPARRVAAWALLGWGWLHAIGGGLLSVLPLPWWPYQPEQSLRHYTFHALYAVLQVPLLIVLARYQRSPRAVRPASRYRAGSLPNARSPRNPTPATPSNTCCTRRRPPTPRPTARAAAS